MKYMTLYGEELETKKCLTCEEIKLVTDFRKETYRSHNSCKQCEDMRRKQVFEIKKTINFSQDAFCELCGRKKEDFNDRYKGNPFCVDHEHGTGQLRGILCMDCNTGLARFNDDVERLKKAIKYLELWNAS